MRSRCSSDLEWPCPNREDYRPDDPQPSATGVERPVGEMPVSHHIPASRMAYLLDRSVPPGKIVDLGGARGRPIGGHRTALHSAEGSRTHLGTGGSGHF